jgi:hypothetical protein
MPHWPMPLKTATPRWVFDLARQRGVVSQHEGPDGTLVVAEWQGNLYVLEWRPASR